MTQLIIYKLHFAEQHSLVFTGSSIMDNVVSDYIATCHAVVFCSYIACTRTGIY